MKEPDSSTGRAPIVSHGAGTVYAVALLAYVAIEVLTRGLIALRDTRTPLLTSTLRLAGRALIVALLLDRLRAVAIPVASAATATLETLALGAILGRRLWRPHSLVAVAT